MGDLDEKQMVSVRGHKSTLIGISLLLLSILLTCSVAALVYMAVTNRQPDVYQKHMDTSEHEEANVHAKIGVKTNDQQQQTEEELSYNEITNVAFYQNSDGTFTIDDFGKGIRIQKSPADKTCFLMPIGSGADKGRAFEEFMQNNDGKVVHANTSEEIFTVLPGKVEDTSFLPSVARRKCSGGFRWMVPSAEISGQHSIQKREKICSYSFGCFSTSSFQLGICRINIRFVEELSTFVCPGNLLIRKSQLDDLIGPDYSPLKK